jgi:hypothetical protein
MVTIKIDSELPSDWEMADFLNDIAMKIREGNRHGIGWDLEGVDEVEIEEDLLGDLNK